MKGWCCMNHSTIISARACWPPLEDDRLRTAYTTLNNACTTWVLMLGIAYKRRTDCSTRSRTAV